MGGSRRTGAACVFTHPRESTMPDLEAFVDGERLGLIGAARSMEAGPRRSRLEARPFAVQRSCEEGLEKHALEGGTSALAEEDGPMQPSDSWSGEAGGD